MPSPLDPSRAYPDPDPIQGASTRSLEGAVRIADHSLDASSPDASGSDAGSTDANRPLAGGPGTNCPLAGSTETNRPLAGSTETNRPLAGSTDANRPLAGSPLGGLWRRAAVYGGLWGAVEVTFGGLLHAVRIPMAGVILAAGEAGFLAAVHRLSPRPLPGLVLAVATVAALVRCLTPTGALLNPLVAIIMAGLMMELCLRLPGRNLGALVGGALAVLWSVAQMVLTHMVFIGPDVLRVYEAVGRAVGKVTGLQARGWLLALAVPLAGLAILGAAGAAWGLRLGRIARARRDQEPFDGSPTCHGRAGCDPAGTWAEEETSGPAAPTRAEAPPWPPPAASRGGVRSQRGCAGAGGLTDRGVPVRAIADAPGLDPSRGVTGARVIADAPGLDPSRGVTGARAIAPARALTPRRRRLLLGLCLLGVGMQLPGHPAATAAALAVVFSGLAILDPEGLRRLGSWRFWLAAGALSLATGLLVAPPTAHLGPVPISVAGLLAAAVLLARAATLFAVAMALGRLVDGERLARLAARAGLRRLGPALALALQVTPTLMRAAQRSRAEARASTGGGGRWRRLEAAGVSLMVEAGALIGTADMNPDEGAREGAMEPAGSEPDGRRLRQGQGQRPREALP